jgi:hypothetical protein
MQMVQVPQAWTKMCLLELLVSQFGSMVLTMVLQHC